MDLAAASGERYEEVPTDDVTRLPDELPLDDLIAATVALLGGTWTSAGSDGYGAYLLLEGPNGVSVSISPCGGQDDDEATLTLSACDGEVMEDGFAALPPVISLDDAARLLRTEVLSAKAALLDVRSTPASR